MCNIEVDEIEEFNFYSHNGSIDGVTLILGIDNLEHRINIGICDIELGNFKEKLEKSDYSLKFLDLLLDNSRKENDLLKKENIKLHNKIGSVQKDNDFLNIELNKIHNSYSLKFKEFKKQKTQFITSSSIDEVMIFCTLEEEQKKLDRFNKNLDFLNQTKKILSDQYRHMYSIYTDYKKKNTGTISNLESCYYCELKNINTNIREHDKYIEYIKKQISDQIKIINMITQVEVICIDSDDVEVINENGKRVRR